MHGHELHSMHARKKKKKKLSRVSYVLYERKLAALASCMDISIYSYQVTSFIASILLAVCSNSPLKFFQEVPYDNASKGTTVRYLVV